MANSWEETKRISVRTEGKVNNPVNCVNYTTSKSHFDFFALNKNLAELMSQRSLVEAGLTSPVNKQRG